MDHRPLEHSVLSSDFGKGAFPLPTCRASYRPSPRFLTSSLAPSTSFYEPTFGPLVHRIHLSLTPSTCISMRDCSAAIPKSSSSLSVWCIVWPDDMKWAMDNGRESEPNRIYLKSDGKDEDIWISDTEHWN